MSEPFVSNVISQKYDTALDFHVTMYDNLPYQRDSDYCNAEKIALVSGRVIKYYFCFNQPEAFTVNNKDDVIEEILVQSNTVSRSSSSKRVSAVSSSHSAEITPEQIQTLLDDREDVSFGDFAETDFNEEEANDIDAPANAANAFADVEDW